MVWIGGKEDKKKEIADRNKNICLLMWFKKKKTQKKKVGKKGKPVSPHIQLVIARGKGWTIEDRPIIG